jgi:hypothetical protein
MCKIILVHLIKAFKHLKCQLLDLHSRNNSLAEEVVVKIAMAAVFHGDED